MVINKPMPLGVTGVMLAELDFDEQIALCRELGVSHYVFRPRYIGDNQREKPYHPHGNHKFDLTPQRLIDEGPQLKRKLEDAGMTPFYSVPRGSAGDDDSTLGHHMRGAAAAGCSRLRLIPPPYPTDEPFDYEVYLAKTRQRFETVLALAADFGLKIVIEMHAGNSASSPALARNIVHGFDPRKLGLIVDLPNFAREGFIEPNLAVSVLGPYLDHVHLGGNRRVEGDYDAQGFRQSAGRMCPLTESDLHIPTWVGSIAAVNPEAVLVIEDYTSNMSGQLRLRTTAAAINRLVGQ